MLKKSISAGLFSPSKKNKKHILIDAIKQSILSPTKNKRQKRSSTIIKLYNSHSSKKNTIFFNNKESSNLHIGKIYLKLEKSEEIAKIVNEEEKKRYFNREFHINKNINREELKRRIKNSSPSYQRTFNKKNKNLKKINSVSIKRRKNRAMSSSYNNYGIKSIKSLININNKLIHNYKYQGEKIK